jgi:hypothetical protein
MFKTIQPLIVTSATDKCARKHVDEDVLPFTYLFPDYSTPMALYATQKEWLAHMERTHAKKQWFCYGCSPSQPRLFDSRQAYVEHFNSMAQHVGQVTSAQIESLAKLLMTPVPLSFASCPLCRWSENSDSDSILHMTLQDHIASHMLQFSLRALPTKLQTESDDISSSKPGSVVTIDPSADYWNRAWDLTRSKSESESRDASETIANVRPDTQPEFLPTELGRAAIDRQDSFDIINEMPVKTTLEDLATWIEDLPQVPGQDPEAITPLLGPTEDPEIIAPQGMAPGAGNKTKVVPSPFSLNEALAETIETWKSPNLRTCVAFVGNCPSSSKMLIWRF